LFYVALNRLAGVKGGDLIFGDDGKALEDYEGKE
jgi:hypothetical protein